MDVNVLSALQDNYMYLIVCKATKQAAVVDPVEPQKVLECVEKQGAVLTSVLTTHHHWDHAGGNQELLRLHPGLDVYGGDNRIEAMTKKVEHKTKFNVGNLTVECLTTPCHTVGHICYSVTPPDNEVAVFTGDTLFLGGCGRFFEGTAENMDKALNEILGKLPGKMKVYCGHEYSMQNLKFAQLVEPDNEEIKKKIAWVEQRRKDGLPTVPSTIDEEKSYNPFMRVRQTSVMKHTKTSEPIETMRSLRLEKDNFKG